LCLLFEKAILRRVYEGKLSLHPSHSNEGISLYGSDWEESSKEDVLFVFFGRRSKRGDRYQTELLVKRRGLLS